MILFGYPIRLVTRDHRALLGLTLGLPESMLSQ